MKATIYKRVIISSAHWLNLPYDSKCKNLHGHNYKIELWITGEVNENGMVVDFTHIKQMIKTFDHQSLNDFLKQPTAENFAQLIADKIFTEYENVSKIKVRVWETCTAYAEVELVRNDGR